MRVESRIELNIAARLWQRRRWWRTTREDARKCKALPLYVWYILVNNDPRCWHGQLRRLRGTANTSRELPVVHIGRSVDEFYDHLKTTSDAGRKLPNWCAVKFSSAKRTGGLIFVAYKAWRAVSGGTFTGRPCL